MIYPEPGRKEELLKLVAARKGHFKLESGHHGNIWLDLDRLFLQPGPCQVFAKELANRLVKYPISAVCGPLVGGAFLAQGIAAVLNVPFFYTDRIVMPTHSALFPVQYRIPQSLRADVRGKQFAIIDDAINAGSAVRGTYAELQSLGGQPVVIAALLTLGSAARGFFTSQNLPVESLASLTSEVWAPSECPLCAAAVALEEIQYTAA